MIHLTENEMSEILTILKQHVQNGFVVAFGSRYKGNPKSYSDLDLAVVKYDENSMSIKEYGELKEAFEESELNFRVDVVDYWGASKEFRQIIDNGCYRIFESNLSRM